MWRNFRWWKGEVSEHFPVKFTIVSPQGLHYGCYIHNVLYLAGLSQKDASACIEMQISDGHAEYKVTDARSLVVPRGYNRTRFKGDAYALACWACAHANVRDPFGDGTCIFPADYKEDAP